MNKPNVWCNVMDTPIHYHSPPPHYHSPPPHPFSKIGEELLGGLLKAVKKSVEHAFRPWEQETEE